MNYDLNAAASPRFQVSYAKMAKSVTIGTIISLFASVALLIIFAVIINAAFGDPDRVLHIFTGIGAAAGAFAGGFRASRLNGANGLAVGLMTGAATGIILFIIMLFARDPASAGADITFRLVMILCIVVFACIGGIFAVNFGASRKSGRYSLRKK